VKTAPLLKAKTTSTNTITNTSTKNKNKNNYNLAAVSSNFDNDKIRRKIENAVDGLPFQCFNFLHNRVLPANK